MANVYRVRTELVGVTGTPFLSTQHYELIGVSSQAGAEEASDAVRAFWTALTTVIDTAIDVNVDPNVDELDEATGALTASYSTSGAVTAPAATGDALPRSNQGLVQILTGAIRLGRRVKGRVFVPGPMETANGAGIPAAAYLTSLDTAANALLTAGAGSQLCVYRRPVYDVNGALERAGEAVTTDGNVTAMPYWAILRSRRD